MPRGDVSAKLSERIAEGSKIQAGPFHSENDLDTARQTRTRWSNYNEEYLTRAFDNDSISTEYKRVGQWGSMFVNASFNQLVEGFLDGIANQINCLMSIVERLDLIPESENLLPLQVFPSSASPSTKAVFIVHGRDDTAKIEVARFVEKLGLQAVILHEQGNQGSTIIEKFERHAAQVGFAVVLLTPDDVAAPKTEPSKLQARARQNVILELGYFCGALSRERVCVLYWPDVELPSDIHGLTYVAHDPRGGWHLPLAKEIKLAGLDVDLNKAF
jgi:predicted nucleotide-binding protein